MGFVSREHIRWIKVALDRWQLAHLSRFIAIENWNKGQNSKANLKLLSSPIINEKPKKKSSSYNIASSYSVVSSVCLCDKRRTNPQISTHLFGGSAPETNESST